MEIIRQRQPKRAAGFQPVKQFAHKAKHRRSANDVAMALGVTLSAWGCNYTGKVDTNRVNWQGTAAERADMRPRVRR